MISCPLTIARVMLEVPVNVECQVQRVFLEKTAAMDTPDLTETG